MQITICSLNDFYKIDFTSNDMAVIRIFDTTEIENYLHRQRGKSIQEENTELLEKTRVKDILTLFFDDIEPPYSKDKLLLIQ